MGTFAGEMVWRVVARLAGAAMAMAVMMAHVGSEEEKAPRETPLRELSVAKTLAVEDFGAKADDQGNDLAAIQAALAQAASAGEPTEVAFHKGRYYLDPKGKGGQALAINRAKNLVIDGHGAEIVLRNPQMGFLRLMQCERVIVRNFSIDYDPSPVTQGWVKAVEPEAHALVVALAPGFPSLEEAHFQTGTHRWAVIKDKENPRRLKRGLPNVAPLEDWERVGERTFRVVLADWFPIERVAAGDPYVQIARNNGAAAFLAVQAASCTYSGIRILSAPAASYTALQCSAMNYLDCRTAPPEGRWHSTGADGIYTVWNRIGPWIEGCEFDANGDDGVIIKTKGANCTRKIDDKTFVLRGRPDLKGLVAAFPVERGDTLKVFDPMKGLLLGEAKVVSQDSAVPGKGNVTQTGRKIVFDRPLPGIEAGTEWGSPIFYNDDTVGGSFVVRNNVFRNVRRWGLLCESRDGLIENNVFEGSSAQAILLINADQGHQDSDGFVSRNIVIRGNTFRDCFVQWRREMDDFSATVASVVIGVYGRRESQSLQSKVVPWQGHENLVIEGNHFFDWRNTPALRVECAKGVKVRRNEFECGARQTDAGAGEAGARPAEAGAAPQPAILVRNASDVNIQGNRVTGWQGPAQAAIAVDEKATRHVTIDGAVREDEPGKAESR